MTDESIAIVGASCRFPGAENLDEFWQLLASAGDAVSEIDDRRWSTRFYYHPNRSEPGKSYTWSAGLISGVDLFEPSFFGISPREAAQIDPQQRLLLELAWHAFEDAGIPPSKMSGSATGVYIGASTTDYSDLRIGDPAGADSYFMTGSTLSILANRISYVFDLRGPKSRRRHGVLVLASRPSPCLRGDSQQKDRRRYRRRDQPPACALSFYRLLARLDALPARPLLCL